MDSAAGIILPDLCPSHLDQVRLEEIRRGTTFVVLTKVMVALFQRTAETLVRPGKILAHEELAAAIHAHAPLCCYLGQAVFEEILHHAWDMKPSDLGHPPKP